MNEEKGPKESRTESYKEERSQKKKGQFRTYLDSELEDGAQKELDKDIQDLRMSFQMPSN